MHHSLLLKFTRCVKSSKFSRSLESPFCSIVIRGKKKKKRKNCFKNNLLEVLSSAHAFQHFRELLFEKFSYTREILVYSTGTSWRRKAWNAGGARWRDGWKYWRGVSRFRSNNAAVSKEHRTNLNFPTDQTSVARPARCRRNPFIFLPGFSGRRIIIFSKDRF